MYTGDFPEAQTKSNYFYEGNPKSIGEYLELKELIMKHCAKDRIILLVRAPLKSNALHYLNGLYQHYNIWMTMSSSNLLKQQGIQSFYRPLFVNVINNDFNREKVREIENGSIRLLALTMLKLGE